MTKLAEFLPPYCASCYQQDQSQPFVDFEAAYDGPVLEGRDPETGARPQIDDLILCRTCLKDAARLLGWETEDTRSEREREQAEIARLKEQRRELVEYSRKLEDTIARGRDADRLPVKKGRPVNRPEVLAA